MNFVRSASPAIDALACLVLLRMKMPSTCPGYIVLVSKVYYLLYLAHFARLRLRGKASA